MNNQELLILIDILPHNRYRSSQKMVCKSQNILEEHVETGAWCHKDNSNSNWLLLQPKTTNIFVVIYPVSNWDRTVKDLHNNIHKRARLILQRRSFGDKV